MMKISTGKNSTKWHCQCCMSEFNCDDHLLNNVDCNKCEFRHQVFIELEDLLSSVEGLTPEQLEDINKLQKFYTI